MSEKPDSTKRILVEFGALSRPLADQISHLGFNKDDVEHWQKDADAITRLCVRQLIAEGESKRAMKKLISKIESAYRQGKKR